MHSEWNKIRSLTLVDCYARYVHLVHHRITSLASLLYREFLKYVVSTNIKGE